MSWIVRLFLQIRAEGGEGSMLVLKGANVVVVLLVKGWALGGNSTVPFTCMNDAASLVKAAIATAVMYLWSCFTKSQAVLLSFAGPVAR